jgi:hypothetical protein
MKGRLGEINPQRPSKEGLVDQTAPERKNTTKSGAKLYMAIELSSSSWKLAFTDGAQRVRTTPEEALTDDPS